MPPLCTEKTDNRGLEDYILKLSVQSWGTVQAAKNKMWLTMIGGNEGKGAKNAKQLLANSTQQYNFTTNKDKSNLSAKSRIYQYKDAQNMARIYSLQQQGCIVWY